MLRITDARTGHLVDAAPVRRGLTRVEAHTEGFDATALRVMVVADLLVRALELGGTPVWALLRADRGRPQMRTAAAALGVRPFEEDGHAEAGLGEAQILHVVAEGGAAPDGVRVAVAAVPADGFEAPTEHHGPDGGSTVPAASGTAAGSGRPGGPDAPDRPAGADGPVGGDAADAGPRPGAPAPPAPAPPASASLAPGVPPGLTDPAALRLVLLSHPRATPVRLDPAAVTGAARTLAHWRRSVADWARHPSRPVPDPVRARLRSAWENDLDAVGVLAVLRDVEHAPDLPDGARFETFARADRLLGLELTRDLGTPA
ncbi:hypothetical protein [Streptomyces sp. bgisy022]|uniref:hypothetical protein n=1 Tax=Streptomyces sp. bgisy022 TaxID=3413769 RepID=UPI003D74AE83